MASAQELAAQLLREREGFAGNAYWDVNAYRAGYGSDTWTDSEGKVHKVKKGTAVTAEDAARDLARRIPETQQQGIIAYVGQDAWDKLPAGAKAAVTSLAYNYGGLGKLPSLVKAVKSGDTQQIATAISNRAVDNNGINAKRRQAEAEMVLRPPAGIPFGALAGGAATGTAGLPPPMPRERPNPGFVVGDNGLQSLPPPPLDNRPMPSGSSQGWWNTQDAQPGMMGRGQPSQAPTGGLAGLGALLGGAGAGAGYQPPPPETQVAEGNIFSGLGGMLGNAYNATTGAIGGAVQGINNAVTSAPAAVQQAGEAFIKNKLNTVQGRSDLLNPIMAGLFTPRPGMTGVAGRYGATAADRQQAARNRELISMGMAIPVNAGSSMTLPRVIVSPQKPKSNSSSSGFGSKGYSAAGQALHDMFGN